jgi:hypothetical protein
MAQLKSCSCSDSLRRCWCSHGGCSHAITTAAAGTKAFEVSSFLLVGVVCRADQQYWDLQATWAKITQRLNKAVQVRCLCVCGGGGGGV